VQARTGAEQLAGRHADLIRPYMPGGLARFLQSQSWLVIGGEDGNHRVWASVLTGPPGFAFAADAVTLRIAAAPDASDPLHDLGTAEDGEPIGVLTIDLARRLRARINGRVSREAGALVVSVEQAYANCSKYIQRRVMIPSSDDARHCSAAVSAASERLPDEHVELIALADTCFIATMAPGHGADVSHRGGHPGFLRSVDDNRALRFPDFVGNGMFNTLGNLELDNRAGLAIPDFRTGDMLQISGDATVDYEPPPDARTPGTPRTVELAISCVHHATSVVPAPGGPVEYSRFLPPRVISHGN
jgi:uncharacterized protein